MFLGLLDSIPRHPVIFSADDWGVQSPPKGIGVFRFHETILRRWARIGSPGYIEWDRRFPACSTFSMTRCWFQFVFYLHPETWRWSHFDKHMFQMDGEKPEPIVIHPAETNIVPKNQWLEDQTPCGRPPYQGRTVSFREVCIHFTTRNWFQHSFIPSQRSSFSGNGEISSYSILARMLGSMS